MKLIAQTTAIGLPAVLMALGSVSPMFASELDVGRRDDAAIGFAKLRRSTPTQIAQAASDTADDPQLRTIERLEERLRLLESQQQQLLNELKTLKQRLAETEAGSDAIAETEPSDAEMPNVIPEPEAIAIETSERPQGLYLSGEALFLQANPSTEIDFAIADPGDALAVSGEVATVDYDLSTNTRIAVGYRKDNVDIRATYLNIESSGDATSERPENGFLFSTLTTPVQNDSAETASARTALVYTTTDLEVGYALQAARNFDVRLAAGLRFADTNQDLNVKYDGVDFTEATADFDYDFAGFGPKLGLEARWKLGAGFSAFGKATGTLLMGDARSVYRETDNAGADIVVDIEQRNNDKIIPVAEMALGLDWTRALSDNIALALTAGYEYQNWFNAYSEPRFVDDSSPGLFSTNETDMSFQGFFFKTGLSLDF